MKFKRVKIFSPVDDMTTSGLELATKVMRGTHEGTLSGYVIEARDTDGELIGSMVLEAGEARFLLSALASACDRTLSDAIAPDKALPAPHIDLEAQVSFQGDIWQTVQRGDDVNELKSVAFDSLTSPHGGAVVKGVRVVEIHTHAVYNVRGA